MIIMVIRIIIIVIPIIIIMISIIITKSAWSSSSPGDESEEEAGDDGEAEQDFEPGADHTLGEMQSIGKIIASIIFSQNDDYQICQIMIVFIFQET